MAEQPNDLEKAAEMAERVAERLLGELDTGVLTLAELRNRHELNLIVEVARLLQGAGANFPPSIRRLAERGAEQP